MISSSKKLKCWHAVEGALKSGDIIKPDHCDRCGKIENPLQAHHENYDYPLAVEWLCKKCHMVDHHGAQKDNSTFSYKQKLRINLLKELESPVVLETHGGLGEIFKICYCDFPGIVFEKKKEKAFVLGRQRPDWFVYQSDCIKGLEMGAGKYLNPNFIDIDPYGDPWPVIDAFFDGDYNKPEKICIAVNDGLRQKLKMNGAWSVNSLKGMVEKYGNSIIYGAYLDICKEMLTNKALDAGYNIERWVAYYCGHLDQMTHYAAVLRR